MPFVGVHASWYLPTAVTAKPMPLMHVDIFQMAHATLGVLCNIL